MKNKCFLLVLLGILAAAFLLSCGKIKLHEYANADQYAVGGRVVDGDISHIMVHWVNGSVFVNEGSAEGVEISEYAEGELSREETVHYWLDNSILHVEFAESGTEVSDSFAKDLTITIPMESELIDLIIVGSQCDITVSHAYAESLMASTTKGNIMIQEDRELLSITALSKEGNLSVHTSAVDEVVLTSQGGDIEFEGAVQCATLASRDGSAVLTLPEDSTFIASLLSAGTFTSDFPYVEEKESYVVGEGDDLPLITFSSKNGNLTIRKK